jgi:hypothetical protein
MSYDIDSFSLSDITNKQYPNSGDIRKLIDEARDRVSEHEDWTDDKPNRTDFATDEEYDQAIAEWKDDEPDADGIENAREVLKEIGDLENDLPTYDEQLIRDDCFEDHAQQIAEDCFDIPSGWPCCHIDWEAAANALKHDYSCIEIGGTDFYYRG